MGVVIESHIWEPNQALNIFLFISCFLSIYFSPNYSNKTSTIFDHSCPSSLIRFQRSFLLLYSLSSVMEGLWAVFGEYELEYYGISRDQMILSLCIGYIAALFIASFLGILSDLIGAKKICLLFYTLHLIIAIWKRFITHPSLYLASICISIASSLYYFCFETWMVIEHDKLGQRQETFNDMFWLMTFFESVSLLVSQVLGNWLIGSNKEKDILSPYTLALILSIISIIFLTKGQKEPSRVTTLNDYKQLFSSYMLRDKKIWLLSWAQTCLHFSFVSFWILWAPTLVADGREIVLGLIYPCLLGARMLGSTACPWLFNGPISFKIEEYLAYAFVIMGLLLSIVAYDYQEIEILVMLFCLFHACSGLVLPSLARLRSIYVPNELRGGMMSLSLVPGNAALLVFLVQGGYYKKIENSTIIGFAALGLFSAACCMYMLKKLGKQNLRKL